MIAAKESPRGNAGASLWSTRTNRHWLLVLVAAQMALVSGCTTALWDKSTFARSYQPSNPSNLRLFYSPQSKDILVQYDERREKDQRVRTRCFWLESNFSRANPGGKPHFVPSGLTNGLAAIPVCEVRSNRPPAGLDGLYAIAKSNDQHFTLYSGKEQLDVYNLPFYTERSQKIKQVLLTPGAVAVDIITIGAAMGYASAPEILRGFNR